MIKHPLIDHLPITGDMVSLWLPSGQNRAMDIIRGNHGQCDGTHPNVPVLPSLINPSVGWETDGLDDKVVIPNDKSLQITDEIAIGAWIRPIQTGMGAGARIVNKGTKYLLQRDAGNLSIKGVFTIDGITRNSPSILWDDEIWNFFLITYSSTTHEIKIFKEGEYKDKTTLTGLASYEIETDGSPLQIGGIAIGWWKGYIALPFIANKAWSEAQVNNFYLGTRSFFSPRG